MVRSNTGKRKACKILVGKPVGKRPFELSRRRWEGSIEKDFKKTWKYG
jgi:hypothetical protein